MALSQYLNTAPQVVEITIPTGATSATATISAVSSLAAILWCGFTTDNTGATGNSIFPRIELTNSTTVTAYRNTSSATLTVTVRGVVLDPAGSLSATPFVSSVQHGTIDLSGVQTSNTATITTVDLTRSTVIYQGYTMGGGGGNVNSSTCYLDLQDASTVRARRASSGLVTMRVGFSVWEFDASVIQSVQEILITLANANQEDITTVSSVDPANTMLFFGGNNSAGGAIWSSCMHRAQLTAPTQVTTGRIGTGAGTRNIALTLVELVPGIIQKIQTGGTNISTSTPVDQSIATINEQNTAAYLSGQYCALNTLGADNVFCTVKLQDDDTLRIQKTGTVNLSNAGWEVAQFTPPATAYIKGGNILGANIL